MIFCCVSNPSDSKERSGDVIDIKLIILHTSKQFQMSVLMMEMYLYYTKTWIMEIQKVFPVWRKEKLFLSFSFSSSGLFLHVNRGLFVWVVAGFIIKSKSH